MLEPRPWSLAASHAPQSETDRGRAESRDQEDGLGFSFQKQQTVSLFVAPPPSPLPLPLARVPTTPTPTLTPTPGPGGRLLLLGAHADLDAQKLLGDLGCELNQAHAPACWTSTASPRLPRLAAATSDGQ